MLRAAKKFFIKSWLGLNSYASRENLEPGWWFDSSNITVSGDGSAAVLRSPKNFNTALATGNKILSAFDYDKTTGNLILFDINLGAASVASVATYVTSGTVNTLLRSNQAAARWKRLLVNDWAYGINGSEFIQTNGTQVFAVGIASAGAASSIAIVGGGSGTLLIGVTASYAYYNSTTGHVGMMGTASAISGTGGTAFRMTVVASTQTGVDGIVVFLSEDGGAVRYLVLDAAGNPRIFANASANIDISIADMFLDKLTSEPAYNSVPPQNAFFMFRARGNRICLCDFRGATTRQQIQYNCYETVFIGQPWESWWPLNIIIIPNKGDAARGGIATSVGDLILGEQDSYLVRGTLTDKASAPEASVSVTESIQPLQWSIGTKSPYTIKGTPFGEIWLDQNKRLQMWTHEGYPVEAGLPIRTSLAEIQDTFAARNMAEAEWYQHGDNGGIYALTGSTTGTTNNKLFILTVYKDPETGQLRFASSVSDISAQCVFVAEVAGVSRLFAGVTDRIREFLQRTEGAGWVSTQTRFFKLQMGTDDEYGYWSSLRFNASSILGLVVKISDMDKDGVESNIQTVDLVEDEGSFYGSIDQTGHLKVLTFTFNSTDTEERLIKNLRVAYKQTGRIL